MVEDIKTASDIGLTPDSGIVAEACAPSEVYADNCWPIVPSKITTCYDDNLSISCPGTAGTANCGATAFCGQDAQYPDLNAQVFTCVDATGQDLASCPTSTTSGETVRDELTHLIWQRAHLPAAMPWQDAVDYCNNLTYGGHSDWQLPNAHELQSIVDDTRAEPALDVTVFPRTRSIEYWTSSPNTHPGHAGKAWYVHFRYGDVWAIIGSANQSNHHDVRCVRVLGSGKASSDRFEESTIAGDIVVIDSLTGLMWQKWPAGPRPGHLTASKPQGWQAALAYCESSIYANYDDWRVPKKKVLMSLVNYDLSTPASEIIPTPNSFFWSSSTFVVDPTRVWRVCFLDGHVGIGLYSDKPSPEPFVRCVR